MSVLTQFFGGGGGGSPTSIRTRVQVTEGGHGASCMCFNTRCPLSGTCYGGPMLISGRGGGVGDFNLNIEPGTVCTITVGEGGSSYSSPFDAGPTQPMLSDPSYPGPVQTSNCGPYVCGKFGTQGGPSKFGALGFYPNGTSVAKFPRICPAIPTAVYCICLTAPNFPSVHLEYLCPTDLISEQNVPCNSAGRLSTYNEWNKGFRGFDEPTEYNAYTKIIEGNTCTCVCMSCCCGICEGCGITANFYGVSGGGADNFSQIDRWSGGAYTDCCYAMTSCGCGKRICQCFDCGGYTSYITGAVCSYGVGGFIVSTYCVPAMANQDEYIDPSCGKAYCCSDHSEYRFPGSGGGASSVYSNVLLCPTTPCDSVCSGCPGSVIVQYPTCYAAATTSSPSVIDCSPNTPGMRTYKFLCPGSITFP